MTSVNKEIEADWIEWNTRRREWLEKQVAFASRPVSLVGLGEADLRQAAVEMMDMIRAAGDLLKD